MAIYELEERVYFDGGLPADVAEVQEDTSEQNIENNDTADNNSDAGNADNTENVSIALAPLTSEDNDSSDNSDNDSDSESQSKGFTDSQSNGLRDSQPDSIAAIIDSIDETTITDDFLDNQNFLIISSDNENFEEIATSLNDITTLIIYDSDDNYDSIIQQLKVELGDCKAVNIGIVDSEKIIDNSEKCNEFLDNLNDLQYFDGEINLINLSLETTEQGLESSESITSNMSILSSDYGGNWEIKEDTESGTLTDYFDSESSLLVTDSGLPASIESDFNIALYFIDYNVEDIDTILAEISENAVIIELAKGEGIDTITEIINSYTDIDAVHIISQANYAQILLGKDIITDENITEYQETFSSWSDNLSQDADILFYGCDIAKDAQGHEVLNQIADWTGADIAASTNITGGQLTTINEQLSTSIGDWNLEFSTGTIEAAAISVSDYEHHLETYTVTEITDNGFGTVEGTLSWAIAQSNLTTTVDDTITFNLDSGDTITISSQMPEITDTVTIKGNDVTVQVEDQSSSDYRVFAINADGENVTISNMTIKGGDISGNNSDASYGGSIYIAAGIVELNTVTVSGSKAYQGGGIYNEGNLVLYSTDILYNITTYGGGGILSSSDSELNIYNSNISYNQGAHAGGIKSHGIFNLYYSSICHNQATGSGGGGIENNNGEVYIYASTVAYNTSLELGGGINNYGGNLIVVNSTFAYNESAWSGGGILCNNAALQITNSTVAFNESDSSGGGIGTYGTSNTITVSNTIIANNIYNGNLNDVYIKPGNTVNDDGYNIVGKSDGYTWSGTGDITGNDSGIVINLNLDTELKNNGGPTDTLALLDGSVATGTIPADSSWNSSPNTDQRGYYRVSGEPTCIGAYITNFTAPYYRTVTGASGYWTNPLLWEISPDNITWFDASTYPTYTDNTITVRSDANVVFDSAIAIDQTIIENGGILVVGSGYTMTINDDTGTDLDNSGTITVNGEINNTGDIANNNIITILGVYSHAGSLSGTALAYSGDTSTLVYSDSSQQTTSALEFSSSNGPANLIIANTAGVNLNFSRTLSGDFTVGEGYSFTTDENTITVGGAADIAGTITVSAFGALDADGSLTLSGTVSNLGTIYAASDVTFTGISSIGGTFVYDGGNQNIADTDYYNLTLSGSGTKILNANLDEANRINTLIVDASSDTVTFDTNGYDVYATVLSLSSDGTITDSVVERTTDLNISGTSTINGNITTTGNQTYSGAVASTSSIQLAAGEGNITSENTSNDFTAGISIVSANNVNITNSNALTLGASSISGSFTVVAGGAITQVGALAVAGTTDITAGAANNITLENASNNFTGGVRIVSGNDVSLTDLNALVIGNASGAGSVSGNLTVTAGGAITQIGVLTVTGTTDITAGAANNITLYNASNNFTGAVSILSGNNVSLQDSGTLNLATLNISGNITVNSSAKINISNDINIGGTITKQGNSDFDTSGYNIISSGIILNDGTFNSDGDYGTWNISGDVSIAAEAALTATSGNFYVGGNWTIAENGTFENNSGTVIFNGTSEQQITSSGNDFNNVTIANEGATVKLMDNATVSGTLELTDGKGLLDTNSNTLTVNGTIQDDSGGNNFDSDHMIIVNGTGKLHLPVAPNTSYLFPVGTYSEAKGYNYSPVTIEFANGDFSGDDYVEVTAAPVKYSENPCETNFLSRYWNATSSGVVNYEATVTCFYDTADIVLGDGATENDIYGAEYLSGSWINPSPVNENTHSFTIAGIESLAVFSGIAAPYTDSVTINPSTSQTITAGNTIQFSAVAYDQYGNIRTDTATDFTWTNTTSAGLFNSTAAGSYAVNAVYDSVSSGNVTVTVEPGAVNTVSISPSTSQTLTSGETVQFSASAYDLYENLITDTATDFTWVNTTSAGLFNSTAAGSYTVNAVYESVSSENVSVTVQPGEVDTVSISPSEAQTLNSGETVQFSASAYDLYENLITDTATNFTWTNTTNTGLFNTAAAGTYSVKAVYGDVSSINVSVTVNAKPNPTRPDVNNGEMINDGTQYQTRTSWRNFVDNGASDSIDSDDGFEENEVEGVGLMLDSLITFDASIEAATNGEYGVGTGSGDLGSGIYFDGEYELDANTGLMVNGEYGIGDSGGIEQEFDSEYNGIVDLSFDFDIGDSLINNEAIAAYNDRHPLFKTELDLLLEKI